MAQDVLGAAQAVSVVERWPTPIAKLCLKDRVQTAFIGYRFLIFLLRMIPNGRTGFRSPREKLAFDFGSF